MDKLSSLWAFVKSAELGSFVAAGQSLGLSASAVGKGLAQLERRMGVRLLQRTTRSVQLTSDGQVFYMRCRAILEELEAAERLLMDAQARPSGKLSIWAPIAAHHFLMPLVPSFLEQCPGVELDLNFNDRSVTPTDQGIDLVIRSSVGPDSGLVCRPLHRFKLLLCTAPSYFDQRKLPQQPSDLATHRAVRFRHPSTGKLLDWPFPSLHGGALELPQTILSCNNIEAVRSAAMSGLGIACLPDFLVHGALERGQLVQVLPQHATYEGQYFALWPSRHQVPARVRAFVDHLCRRLPVQSA